VENWGQGVEILLCWLVILTSDLNPGSEIQDVIKSDNVLGVRKPKPLSNDFRGVAMMIYGCRLKSP
jgi:hypothetical protein